MASQKRQKATSDHIRRHHQGKRANKGLLYDEKLVMINDRQEGVSYLLSATLFWVLNCRDYNGCHVVPSPREAKVLFDGSTNVFTKMQH